MRDAVVTSSRSTGIPPGWVPLGFRAGKINDIASRHRSEGTDSAMGGRMAFGLPRSISFMTRYCGDYRRWRRSFEASGFTHISLTLDCDLYWRFDWWAGSSQHTIITVFEGLA